MDLNLPTNPDQLAEAKVREHYFYVVRVAQSFGASTGLPWEDYRQEGLLGLMRACGPFDPNRGVPFIAYARRFVVDACRCLYKRETRHRYESVEEMGEREDAAIEFPAPAPKGEPEELEAVRQAMDHLTPKQRRVVQGVYFEDRSPVELAREWGESHQLVSFHHQKALQRLRAILLPQ